jgi:N-acetylmuramoyl-L-alanine amidase
MLSLKMSKLFVMIAVIGVLGISQQGCSTGRVPVDHSTFYGTSDPQATQVPIFNEERLQLTESYSSRHYGRASYRLTDPQIIVVHYTAIATLQDTLQFFQPAQLDRQSRSDIASGGDVNVSAHYLVDSNGALYQLAPEDILCRHTIGFNYTAIGIENVAADAGHLTDRQAEATAALISRLVRRHPSLRYLIGHHEYRDTTLPHYRLFIENDPSYRFTDKIDPGPLFMTKVRQLLHDEYGITLAN